VPAMGQPAPERWWRRGRDQAQAAAQEASGRAAQVLIDVDRLQTDAAESVRMLTVVDPGPTARQVAADWAPVQELANQAVAAYMSAVGSADLGSDLEEPVARHAAQAFHAAAEQLGHAVVAIRRFLERADRPLGQARSAHAAVPDRLQAARVALTSATRGVEAAREAGYQAREAAALLDDARDALTALEPGVQALGLPRTLEGAARVIELSTQAQAEVDSLPGRAAALTRAITAARTFLQVTESHLQGVPETLSELRRSFVYPSFADLEKVPATAARAIESGREQLVTAERLATAQEQRWTDAETAIGAARSEIDSAAKAVQATKHRLESLKAAQQDPDEPLRQARRVLRDAQRFLLAGAERPAPQHVSRLDALGIQLDTAPERLAARNRPDFWAYLTELYTVGNAARAVVDEVRQSRAAR